MGIGKQGWLKESPSFMHTLRYHHGQTQVQPLKEDMDSSVYSNEEHEPIS